MSSSHWLSLCDLGAITVPLWFSAPASRGWRRCSLRSFPAVIAGDSIFLKNLMLKKN